MTDHKEQELLPCPFCGCVPTLIERDTVYARCDSVNCSLQGMGMWSLIGWNTRVPSSQPQIDEAAGQQLKSRDLIKRRDAIRTVQAHIDGSSGHYFHCVIPCLQAISPAPDTAVAKAVSDTWDRAEAILETTQTLLKTERSLRNAVLEEFEAARKEQK